MRQFNHWFANKTVAVVGNATSLFDKEYGKIIDSHDVVCRMNKGVAGIQSISHGSRTDVLVFSQWATVRRVIKTNCYHRVTRFLQTSPKGRHTNYILKQLYPNVESELCPIEIINNLQFKLELHKKQSLSTGITFLELLNTCSPRDVSVFGFDWKETPTFYSSGPEPKHSPHNFEKEKEYCLNTFIHDAGFVLYS